MFGRNTRSLVWIAALVLSASPAMAKDDVAKEQPAAKKTNVAKRAAPAPKEKINAKIAKLRLDPANFDLLPVHDLEKARIFLDHEDVLYRATILHRRATKVRANLMKRGNKNDDGSKKLKKQLESLRDEAAPVMQKAFAILKPYDFDAKCLDLIANAPTGPSRIMRFAHGTVLSVDSLSAKQRTLMDRVVAQVEGAILSLNKQKERQRLLLKQSKVEKKLTYSLLKTFDRELYEIDKRFWRLVDYVLTDEQRSVVYGRLPAKYRQRSQLVEHLYRTPDMSPVQGARLTALLTEMEAEASPDRAAQKRIGKELRNKKLSKADRSALKKEQKATNRRLTEIMRFGYEETRKLLNEDQWLYYRSIPPRVNVNDRRQALDRVLTGYVPNKETRKQLKDLRRAANVERKAAYARVNEIRKESADYGPDSPQMASMMMMMAGASGGAESAQRASIGKAFLDVLPASDTTRWVLGLIGK